MLAAMAVTFGLGVLAASILQRREEARQRLPLRPIAQWETDAGKWGENYPREYEAYRKMAETTTRTKYGGATQRDYLEASPASVVLFAGYSFAQDYRQARGHVYAVEDITKTEARHSEDAGHLLDLQEPRRAAADGLARAGRSSTPASSTISGKRSPIPSAASIATSRTR